MAPLVPCTTVWHWFGTGLAPIGCRHVRSAGIGCVSLGYQPAYAVAYPFPDLACFATKDATGALITSCTLCAAVSTYLTLSADVDSVHISFHEFHQSHAESGLAGAVAKSSLARCVSMQTTQLDQGRLTNSHCADSCGGPVDCLQKFPDFAFQLNPTVRQHMHQLPQDTQASVGQGTPNLPQRPALAPKLSVNNS